MQRSPGRLSLEATWLTGEAERPIGAKMLQSPVFHTRLTPPCSLMRRAAQGSMGRVGQPCPCRVWCCKQPKAAWKLQRRPQCCIRLFILIKVPAAPVFDRHNRKSRGIRQCSRPPFHRSLPHTHRGLPSQLSWPLGPMDGLPPERPAADLHSLVGTDRGG